jgi:hypothetical protein
MNEERIFNLFICFNDGIATEAGARFHKATGTDDELLGPVDNHLEAMRVATRFQHAA